MQDRTDLDRQLILYFYGELEDDARGEVEDRLALDPAARATLDELQQLRDALPPPGPSDPEVLAALRRAVMRHVQTRGAVRARPPRFGVLPPVAFRLAFAGLVAVVAFALGRATGSAPPGARAGADWRQLVLAGQPVRTQDLTVEPALAGVEDVTVDPRTGAVEVRYRTVNEVRVRGAAGDGAIQELLRQALLDGENPSARLRAVKALQALPDPAPRPDSALVGALVALLRKETNEGLRFMAVRALRTLHEGRPLDGSAKQVLLDLMVDDPNSALRIEALQALVETTAPGAELKGYLKAALADSNGFMRYEAERLLEQKGRPLEAMPPR